MTEVFFSFLQLISRTPGSIFENDECKFIPGLQWREEETKDLVHETSSSVVTSASSLEEVVTEKRPIYHQVSGSHPSQATRRSTN